MAPERNRVVVELDLLECFLAAHGCHDGSAGRLEQHRHRQEVFGGVVNDENEDATRVGHHAPSEPNRTSPLSIPSTVPLRSHSSEAPNRSVRFVSHIALWEEHARLKSTLWEEPRSS